MRVLCFKLAADRDDPLLAPAARWIDEVAQPVEFVHVVTMRRSAVFAHGQQSRTSG
jgi:hypothetical protein